MSKVVLITGASSGIGHATASAFARRGLKVAGTARRADRLETLAEAIGTSGGVFLPLTADVRDAEAMRRAVEATVERFGRLDVLIANAGIGQRGAVAEADWDDLETVLRTNIDGVLHSVRAALPAMRATGKDGGGHIVIVSSVMFNLVAPYTATYAASKAFVSSFAASLRLELAAENILVTDVLVGRTVTEFSEKRLGQMGRRAGGMGGRIPEMSAEQVAAGIVRAVLDRPRHRLTLRWIDRLLVAANVIAPGLIGRLSARQYR